MYVNIIIPVFGRAEVLNVTLQALKKQLFKDFCVYLIDQGSSIPIEIMRNTLESDFNIHYIDTPSNTTVSEKHNLAIRESNGDVVIFLDADTVVCANFVAEHVALQRAGYEIVIGYIYGKKGIHREELMYKGKLELDAFFTWFEEIAHFIPDEREKYYESTRDNLMKLPWPWVVFWSGNISVSRKALQNVGGFDRRFKGWGVEDIELGYRLVKSGYELILSRNAWAVHVPHDVDEVQRMYEQTINARLFIQKYPTIENELSLVKSETWNKDCTKHNNLSLFSNDIYNTIIHTVTSSYGTNLLLVGYDERLSSLSQISVIIDPRKQYIEQFSLLAKNILSLSGLCIPYENESFDACIITPVWTMYRLDHIPKLIMEVVRVSHLS